MPLKDADGVISAWIGTNTEIDWLKRAEEVGLATLAWTRHEHARWQALFAQMPVAVVVTAGADHRVELCSDRARVLTTQRELVGQPLATAFPQLAQLLSAAEMDALYAGAAPVRVAGNAGIRELACSALRRADGSVDGLILVAS